jgi:hypothetical protein
MAGKPKVVKKAEKAAVAAVRGGSIKLNKSVKANKAANTGINNASGNVSVPGSPMAKKQVDSKTGSKQSGIKKTLIKRVNQSLRAKGETTLPSYTSKAKSEKITQRMAEKKSMPKSAWAGENRQYRTKSR